MNNLSCPVCRNTQQDYFYVEENVQTMSNYAESITCLKCGAFTTVIHGMLDADELHDIRCNHGTEEQCKEWGIE